jgi:hypothetical protein
MPQHTSFNIILPPYLAYCRAAFRAVQRVSSFIPPFFALYKPQKDPAERGE